MRKSPFHLRVNGDIRGTPNVALITSSDERVGVVPLAEALRRALAEGGDLVEVGPHRTPPVCKILRKHWYEERARAARAQGESWDAGLTIDAHPPTSFSLVSSDLILVMPTFEACGRHGTGFGWQVVAQHLVDAELPQIAPRIRFNSNLETFRVESDDSDALELLRARLAAVLASPSELANVIASVPAERW